MGLWYPIFNGAIAGPAFLHQPVASELGHSLLPSSNGINYLLWQFSSVDWCQQLTGFLIQKWAKDATTDTTFVCTSTPSDSWQTDHLGQVIRIHKEPRTTLFSPIGVQGCPVDLRNLELERVTQGQPVGGASWVKTDFWPGTRGHEKFDVLWQSIKFACGSSVPLDLSGRGLAEYELPARKDRNDQL